MARDQQGRGQGRFGGRRGGRAGRGGGRGHQGPRGNYTPAAKQQEKIFAPHVQGKAQAATYATVKDAIIQYIQKNYRDGNDVAQSLKDGKAYDLSSEQPERQLSENEVIADAAREQAGLDIKYQEELRQFVIRKDNLRQNMIKAYALIFSNYCNKTMQSRVEEHPDFETKIENDPIALLEAIKTLMHDPVRAQYPVVSMTDALTRLINVKQMENEPLLDYVKRFKQLRDVAKSHLGTKILDQFIIQSEDFRKAEKAEDKEKFKDEAFATWMAYLLIRGSDQSKYGSLTKGFVSQYSLGNNQYPKTIQAATDVLSNHKLDAKFYENQKRNRDWQHGQQEKQQDSESAAATSFAQKDVVCYICGKPGHTKPECPNAGNIPRAKWAVNKAIGAMQAKGDDTNTNDDDESDNESVRSEMSTSSRSARHSSRKTGAGWSNLQRPVEVDVSQRHEFVHKQTTKRVNGVESL